METEEKSESKRSTRKKGMAEKMMPFMVIAIVVLAFGIGVMWQKVSSLEKGGTNVANPVAQPQGPTVGKLPEEEAAKLAPLADRDHVLGDRNAEVLLIEYSDFECPFCAKFHPTAKQVLDEYGDKVAWVYRHYPLTQIHPKAEPAAQASECFVELAGEEAFWKFADLVFEDPSLLSNFDSVAKTLGVNAGAFNKCLDSDKYADRVQSDLDEGLAAGVQGTPGNFIVNKKGEVWFLPGAYPYEQVKEAIDEALAS